MAYDSDELSVDNGQPIELYIFSYNGIDYRYTSSQYSQSYRIDGTLFVFSPEYIKRGDSLKLGDSSGTIETCTITVLRTNSVALLYQGAPPEFDAVKVNVFRVHGEGNDDYIQILSGSISQVTFRDSEAELTVTIENALNRFIPRGSLSYFCQNCIYDERCRLNRDDWALNCYADGGFSGLWIYASILNTKPSGYFTDGYMKMGSCYRTIKLHQGGGILLKYPIMPSQKSNSFTVYPGCNASFITCAEKFNNTVNFSGVPYIEPYDAFTHPTGKGAYWVDGNIVYRYTDGSLYSPNL